MSISGDFINMADRDNKYLNNTVTGDETWCFLYDPQTKWKILNINHHFEAKNFKSTGIKERECWKVFF